MSRSLLDRLLRRLIVLRFTAPTEYERRTRKAQLTAAFYGASLTQLNRIYRMRHE